MTGSEQHIYITGKTCIECGWVQLTTLAYMNCNSRSVCRSSWNPSDSLQMLELRMRPASAWVIHVHCVDNVCVRLCEPNLHFSPHIVYQPRLYSPFKYFELKWLRTYARNSLKVHSLERLLLKGLFLLISTFYTTNYPWTIHRNSRLIGSLAVSRYCFHCCS